MPPDSTMAMFAGALFFWVTNRMYAKRPETTGNKLWVETQEPICAGIIAGAALTAFHTSSVRSGFETILKLTTGVGTVYVVRWLWWRVNAASEIAANSRAREIYLGEKFSL